MMNSKRWKQGAVWCAAIVLVTIMMITGPVQAQPDALWEKTYEDEYPNVLMSFDDIEFFPNAGMDATGRLAVGARWIDTFGDDDPDLWMTDIRLLSTLGIGAIDWHLNAGFSADVAPRLVQTTDGVALATAFPAIVDQQNPGWAAFAANTAGQELWNDSEQFEWGGPDFPNQYIDVSGLTQLSTGYLAVTGKVREWVFNDDTYQFEEHRTAYAQGLNGTYFRYNYSGGDLQEFMAATPATDNSLYAVGWFRDGNTDYPVAARINVAGYAHWVEEFDTPGQALSCVTLPSGNVLFGGFDGAGNGWLAEYDLDGAQQNVYTGLNFVPNRMDFVSATGELVFVQHDPSMVGRATVDGSVIWNWSPDDANLLDVAVAPGMRVAASGTKELAGPNVTATGYLVMLDSGLLVDAAPDTSNWLIPDTGGDLEFSVTLGADYVPTHPLVVRGRTVDPNDNPSDWQVLEETAINAGETLVLDDLTWTISGDAVDGAWHFEVEVTPDADNPVDGFEYMIVESFPFDKGFSDVSEQPQPLPKEFVVLVAPNPFNAQTSISVTLPKPGELTLHIYDVSGRLVRDLTQPGTVAAGAHVVSFDASDLASGVYFVRAASANVEHVAKVVLVR